MVSAVHFLRVIFTAAYGSPRRFNYLLGLALFVISLMLGFTGYILLWDMDICWTLTTGKNLLKTMPFKGKVTHGPAAKHLQSLRVQVTTENNLKVFLFERLT